jgi:serine/threonine-protein kinase PknK
VLDLGRAGARPYLVSERIRGTTLDGFAAGAEPAAVLAAIRGPLRALSYLHRARLCHGDVKPANVLVEDGRGVLIDLGCARPFGPAGSEVSGTPGFIAPEALEGGEIDARSDLFALGVSMHLLLAHAKLEPRVSAIFERCARRDPRERPASAAEVLEALGDLDDALRPAVPPAPLLGREEMMQAVAALVRSLVERSDGERVLWITGGPGSGKTRAAREARLCAELSLDVVEGSGRRIDGASDLLARATGEQSISIDRMRSIRDAAATAGPVLLVIDDADRLPSRERDLLRAFSHEIGGAPVGLVAFSSARDGSGSELPLAPLALEHVSAWFGDRLSQRGIADAQRVSGGLPFVLERIARKLSTGELREADLRGAPNLDLETESVTELGLDARRALGAIACLDGAASRAMLDRLGIGREAIAELHAADRIVREESEIRLTRPAASRAILEAIGDERIAIAARVASMLESAAAEDERARSSMTARAIRAWVIAGSTSDALRVAERATDLVERHPAQFCEAFESLHQIEPAFLAPYATVLARSARADRAVELVRTALERDDDPALHTLLGESLVQLGQAKEAIAALGERDGAAAHDVKARALIKLGDYEIATAALARTDDRGLLAALHEDAGVALSYLGTSEAARRHFDEASRGSNAPRSVIRLENYRAINEYRAGNAAGAAVAYERALAVAEAEGLDDHVAHSALNAGAARHQLGDFGRARELYERALRIATVLRKQSTETTLLFDLAKLWSDVGALDRAKLYLERARASGATRGASHVEPAVDALGAEIAALESDFDRAQELLAAAVQRYREQGAERELDEVRIQEAELASSVGEPERALAILAAIDTRTSDVRARLECARAAALCATGRPAEAIRLLDALPSSEQWPLLAMIEREKGRAFEAQRATALAKRHADRARETWERVAATLEPELHDVFWRHPLRARSAAVETRETTGGDASALLRVIEINRRLSTARDPDEIVKVALDAAIDLTGAERGFVILKRDGELVVPHARNLDREKVGKSHLKFSHGIAERTIETGEPISTVDALEDDRFRGNRSVHAMRLRSVVSVPVSSPDGTLGALYVDNRFRRGRFGDHDVEVLVAIADQVAIALENARLISALEERTRELERERQRVEAILSEQAAHIDRLTEEIAEKQVALEHRYEYEQIVGRGEKMRAMLALVDRVVDSSLPVLVTGESGTGKELVARAIHFHGRAKARPFVAINCAALPEPLLESELFGHVKGAFTGAHRDHEGLFVRARGGTLFLDEIGELPLALQAKLLRVLQERELRPVGSSETVPIDVRLVCATNRRLADEIRSGRFREDLFYRIAVVEIAVPPLRDRREDLPLLARHLLDRLARSEAREPSELTSAALRKLLAHGWPGNVRELENALARASLFARDRPLDAGDLDLAERREVAKSARIGSRSEFGAMERDRMLAALEANDWHMSKTAQALGMPRTTFYRRLRAHRIETR